MKHTILLSLLGVSLLSVSMVQAQQDTIKYPLIMWSEKAFPETRESPAAMEMPDVMETIKKTVQSSNPKNIIVVVKDGLSSKEFVMNAKKFTYLKSLVIDHA
jgi:hypothetical protein